MIIYGPAESDRPFVHLPMSRAFIRLNHICRLLRSKTSRFHSREAKTCLADLIDCSPSSQFFSGGICNWSQNFQWNEIKQQQIDLIESNFECISAVKRSWFDGDCVWLSWLVSQDEKMKKRWISICARDFSPTRREPGKIISIILNCGVCRWSSNTIATRAHQ